MPLTKDGCPKNSSWPASPTGSRRTATFAKCIGRPSIRSSPGRRETGSAFVPFLGGNLDDILCEQYERTVGKDNCVRFERLVLQIPPDRFRCHYVKAKVRVYRYLDGSLAVFHGPRLIGPLRRPRPLPGACTTGRGIDPEGCHFSTSSAAWHGGKGVVDKPWTALGRQPDGQPNSRLSTACPPRFF